MALSTLRSSPPIVPLLEYGSFYWGVCTRRGTAVNVETLTSRVLARFGEHISTQPLLPILSYNKDRLPDIICY